MAGETGRQVRRSIHTGTCDRRLHRIGRIRGPRVQPLFDDFTLRPQFRAQHAGPPALGRMAGAGGCSVGPQPQVLLSP